MQKIEIVPNGFNNYIFPSEDYGDFYDIAYRRRLFSFPKMIFSSTTSNIMTSLGRDYLSLLDIG